MIRPGYIITNFDLEIVSLNDAIKQWTTANLMGLIGCPLADIFPELVGMEGLLQQIIQAETEPLTLAKIHRQNGPEGIIYFDLYLEQMPMSDDHLLVQVVDVSEQARLAQELTQERNELRLNVEQRKRVEAELRAANASKDKFFSILAHDLRNPLQGFLTYTDLLIRDPNLLDPVQLKETFASLNINAKNLYKLLENLLTWARVQTGMLKPQPRMVDLRELAEINVHLFKQRAEQKQIQLSHTIEPNCLAHIDYDMINTALRNLLSNALKFTTAQGTIVVSSTLLAEEWYQLSVRDNGVGMRPEVQAKVFKIDQKYVTLGTLGEPGTGLGLLLCKELVEENGGQIWVESQLGKGSTFHFTVPKVSQADIDSMMADLTQRIG